MDTMRVYIVHPIRRSRCFVLDLPLKLRSSNTSKPKRTVTHFMYMCHTHLCPLGLPANIDNTKIIKINSIYNRKNDKNTYVQILLLLSHSYSVFPQATPKILAFGGLFISPILLKLKSNPCKLNNFFILLLI